MTKTNVSLLPFPLCLFVRFACACSPEVTVTSSSPTPFVSPRGFLKTNLHWMSLSLLSSTFLLFLLLRVALKLRSLRFQSPSLCRIAVFFIQTIVSLRSLRRRGLTGGSYSTTWVRFTDLGPRSGDPHVGRRTHKHCVDQHKRRQCRRPCVLPT